MSRRKKRTGEIYTGEVSLVERKGLGRLYRRGLDGREKRTGEIYTGERSRWYRVKD